MDADTVTANCGTCGCVVEMDIDFAAIHCRNGLLCNDCERDRVAGLMTEAKEALEELRLERESIKVGYDGSQHGGFVRVGIGLDIECVIDKSEIAHLGPNYDSWDDFSYWEMKSITIPWVGSGG